MTPKPRGYWDIKEICFEHSKNYKNRKQFCDNDKNYNEYSRKITGLMNSFLKSNQI